MTNHSSIAGRLSGNASQGDAAPAQPVADDALLDSYQRAAFGYFQRNRNPINGLHADTSRPGSPVSIAVVGFALSAYPVAVERGWISRAEAVAHCTTALHFFRDSNQDGSPEATGFKGFYFHFLDCKSGTRVWRCELSMIDTALLIAGALMASEYFDAESPDEVELRAVVDVLYRRIDWHWAQDNGRTISQGWKPECGFLNYGWEGYSEAIVLYVLALGSPTHPISHACYHNWTHTYQWENIYGYDFLYAGPLFIHQFSHAWIDFRGIRDGFMRKKQCDYFDNTCRAVHVQRAYACINPAGHAGYGQDCWGFSACEGPSDEVSDYDAEPRLQFGYAARGVPYGPDDGTLSPSAVLACMPFEPALAMTAIRTMSARHPEILTDGCFTSAFNADLRDEHGRVWVSPGLFGLDQGIVVMMLENYRSGLPWRLMRGCRWIVEGLRCSGFEGGWLDAAHAREGS